jgi:hypothetical protein
LHHSREISPKQTKEGDFIYFLSNACKEYFFLELLKQTPHWFAQWRIHVSLFYKIRAICLFDDETFPQKSQHVLVKLAELFNGLYEI